MMVPRPDRPVRSTAPEPRGTLLCAHPRQGPEGVPQELRVYLDAYEGRPFLSLRLWQRDVAGGWWPLPGKGCSVRLGEAESVASALRRGLGLAGRAKGPGRAQERASTPPRWDPSTLPPPARRGSGPPAEDL